MTLHLHRSERADQLVHVLGELLLEPLDDPMIPEIVSVPTRGVERWIAQQLSTVLGAADGAADGVCANVDFPFPGRLTADALADATGHDAAADVWRPERLVWPLLDVVDDALGEPWLSTLSGYLRSDATAGDRRFGAARHIADLFDRYALNRPAMLRAWLAGDDLDGHGHRLPDDARWQAELWRRVRRRAATPSPVERLVDGCEQIRRDPALVRLPERFCLFGLTRLPASHLEVLAALAARRDVHLFLLHPSAVLWDGIAVSAPDAGVGPRADDPTAATPRNPLLSSWGRDAREMQLVLAGAGVDVVQHHHPVAEPPGTLLGRIQADIHADRTPDGSAAGAALAVDDRSVQVHSCHGDARQVEVLRDAVLHLLADDPTLEPRDIIVMCPDIETFAPLIHAAFGSGDAGPGEEAGSDLRVRLADRSLRQTNPVLAALADLLVLAEARLTASQVLDFAGRDAVRRRFGFDDDDLERLEDWVTGSGVRWGLDDAHRADYELDGLDANTWRAGLDRILLGAATAEDDLALIGGVLPLDDVGSGDLDLAGRFAEYVDRLGTAVGAFRATHTVDGWTTEIRTAASLLTDAEPGEEWQFIELRRLLDEVTAEATVDTGPADHALSVAEVRALLADRLRGRPTRANFRTGHLTICTLTPMRSVPHRVVCLLGLDDGVFPRRSAADGDDLLARAPCVGDRDSRGEDRQLLLDAVLAASDHLVITYSGRDERTNVERPPAVPVWELLDVADATCRLDDGVEGARVRDRIVVEHPLQPFDGRNYLDGALGRTGAWSFDTVNLAGARSASADRTTPPPFLAGPLAVQPPSVIELDDLTRFLRHPVRAFLRQRLGLVLANDETDLADAMAIELDGLQQWNLGQRLLDTRLRGIDPDLCRAAELARGDVPPGALGEEQVDSLLRTVERLVEEVDRRCPDHASAVTPEGIVELPSGPIVVGAVPGVIDDTILTVTYSRLAAQHRLHAWVRLLLLTAATPGVPYRSVAIGRGDRGKRKVATAGPLAETADERHDLALGHLDDLCGLFVRGLREPLPLYCKTSAAYAEALSHGRSAISAARKEWETGHGFDREDRDLEHRLVLGHGVRLEHLLASPPQAEELLLGWPADEHTRFGRYARRLWDPLLAHERVEQS